MVVEPSILLSILFNEDSASWAQAEVEKNIGSLRMSTVNLSETMILVQDRQPQLSRQIREEILMSGIRFVAPDIEQALIAAEARLRFPINLGDCFAYALAVQEGCPVLTLDGDFKRVDIPVVSPE